MRKINQIDGKMLHLILALAWPTMLEQLMQTAVQYVDTAMVGTLGTEATAAVGATSTVSWLVNSSISALGVGFLAFISQAYGANDKNAAGKAVSQAVLTTIIIGTFFTVLTLGMSPVIPTLMQVENNIKDVTFKYFAIIYSPMLFRAAILIFGTVLRSVGDSKTPMKIGVIMNIVNIILNLLLIYPCFDFELFDLKLRYYGAGWGVLGAGTASAIAFVVGGVLITIAIYKHPLASPKAHSLKPDKKILLPCLKVAMPNMLQRFGTSLGYVAFAALINSTGDISTAAHTIANTVESAFYIPGYGMEMAAATLAGNAYGAKDENQLKKLTKLFLPLEIILMLVTGTLLYIFAPALCSIFSSSEEVITLGSTVLRMVAFSEPFFGFSIIIEGVMQGTGNTKTPFIYNLIGMWAVRIIGTLICTQFLDMGLISAWACMIAHNILMFILYLINYTKGSWNPLRNIKR